MQDRELEESAGAHYAVVRMDNEWDAEACRAWGHSSEATAAAVLITTGVCAQLFWHCTSQECFKLLSHRSPPHLFTGQVNPGRHVVRALPGRYRTLICKTSLPNFLQELELHQKISSEEGGLCASPA